MKVTKQKIRTSGISQIQPIAEYPFDAQNDLTILESISAGQRHRMIAEAAYYRAEERGFETGSEDQDWFAAEVDVDRIIESN